MPAGTTSPPDPAFAAYTIDHGTTTPTHRPCCSRPTPRPGPSSTRASCSGPSQLKGTAIASARPCSTPSNAWVGELQPHSGRPRGTPWPRRTSTSTWPSTSTASWSRRRSSSPTRPRSRRSRARGRSAGTSPRRRPRTSPCELNYGSLPVQLNVLTQETVSPTLGQVVAQGRARWPASAGCSWCCIYTILYYRVARGRGGAGLLITAGVAVGHRLRPRPFVAEPDPGPVRCHRRHRVGRDHRRLLHRLFRTTQRTRRARAGRCAPASTGASGAPSAPSWPPTWCRWPRPWCCTSWPWGRCAASPSSSACPPCSTSSPPSSSPGRWSSCSGAAPGSPRPASSAWPGAWPWEARRQP